MTCSCCGGTGCTPVRLTPIGFPEPIRYLQGDGTVHVLWSKQSKTDQGLVNMTLNTKESLHHQTAGTWLIFGSEEKGRLGEERDFEDIVASTDDREAREVDGNAIVTILNKLDGSVRTESLSEQPDGVILYYFSTVKNEE